MIHLSFEPFARRRARGRRLASSLALLLLMPLLASACDHAGVSVEEASLAVPQMKVIDSVDETTSDVTFSTGRNLFANGVSPNASFTPNGSLKLVSRAKKGAKTASLGAAASATSSGNIDFDEMTGGQPCYSDDRALVSRQLELLGRLHMHYVRICFDRGLVQKSDAPDAPYDFSWYDWIVSQADARGFTPLFILSSNVGGKAPSSQADIDLFTRFVTAAVTHFADRPTFKWEVWNEPNNAPFWKPAPDPAMYAHTALQAVRAFKAVPGNHGEIYVLALGGPHRADSQAFAAKVFATEPTLAAEADAISVHGYTPNYPEADLLVFEKIRKLAAQAASKSPASVAMANTEWNYCSGPAGFTQPVAYGAFISRMMLVNALARMHTSIVYSPSHKVDDNPCDERFGILVDDNTARGTANDQLTRLNTELAGYHLAGRLPSDSDTFLVEFASAAGERKLVGWTASSVPRTVRLRGPEGPIYSFKINGSPTIGSF